MRAWLYNSVGMTAEKEAALAANWRRTLDSIPAMLGRLVYLASLRNANTGVYEHAGLADRVGVEITDRVIRRSHLTIFQEWLCYGLRRQKSELDEHLSSLNGDKREVIYNWLSLEPFGVWVPAESKDVERKLFYTDLAIVMELIRVDYGVVSRDRG
jgi:hypothetical protein